MIVWLIALGSLLLIGLDQITKYWAHVHLRPVGTRPVIDGLFSLSYVENIGAAFGIFEGGRWFFIPLAFVILVFIGVYYVMLPRTHKQLWIRIPLAFVFAGAAGNLIDRIRNGYVVDMFEFTFIRFPVFNVADICLVCGTFALVVAMLFVVKDNA